MRYVTCLISVLYFVFNGLIACAGNIELVEIDGRKNCCIESNHNKCSKDIMLKAGNYILLPEKGAISRWRDDKTANKQEERPWEFYVNIEIGGNMYSLGSLVRYGKAEEAFNMQKNKKVELQIKDNTKVSFWIEDEWEGKDYCEDNRGFEVIKVEKIY